MNKVEILPRSIFHNDNYYGLKMWITAWDKLCIGYPPMFKTDKIDTLFSVCIEPNNETHDIIEHGSGFLNEGIGNTRNLDDACDMILNYIKKHNFNY